MRGLAEDQNQLATDAIQKHIDETLKTKTIRRNGLILRRNVKRQLKLLISKWQNKMLKPNLKARQKTGEFCTKYNMLTSSENPAAGCDEPLVRKT